MSTAFRSGVVVGLASALALTACSGNESLVSAPGSSKSEAAATPQSLAALPRAQQDAIRASTRIDPRWLADIALRKRVGARRRDVWYSMVTRQDGGRSIRSVRQGREVYALTSCTTTYLNVSGTYDTSTDPIIAQQCSTTYYDDGGGLPVGDGGGAIALPTLDPNLYKEPASNFDTSTESGCKIGAKAKFISLSKNAKDNGRTPSPGQTLCGPKNDNSVLQLTGGMLFPNPGDCDYMVVISAGDIEVEPNSGSGRLPEGQHEGRHSNQRGLFVRFRKYIEAPASPEAKSRS
ncbi:MAG TPA: hypothetical protein VK665_03345 [Candidatus Elarobacter sp.]|nr:hypothetical protein [Candidatus Elarobacter sp.]